MLSTASFFDAMILWKVVAGYKASLEKAQLTVAIRSFSMLFAKFSSLFILIYTFQCLSKIFDDIICVFYTYREPDEVSTYSRSLQLFIRKLSVRG